MADAGQDATLVPLSLMLGAHPKARFAGYYLAKELGYYREAGIELRIEQAASGRSPLEALREGRADIALLWLPTAVQARAEGVPLVNLAQILRHSSLVIIARASSGVRAVSDLDGRRLGIPVDERRLPVEILRRKMGLGFTSVPQSASVNLFLRGGVEAVAGLWSDDYHLLLNAGLDPEDLAVLPLTELGVDLPEDGLYALESTRNQRSGPLAAFLTATRRGWEAAAEDPASALDLVLGIQRAARIPANRAHERWMLGLMLDALGPSSPDGWDWRLKREELARARDLLSETGLLDAKAGALTGLGDW
ncbi:ABC transporter substrate-binding protein [Imhoffiella purpurea]|uniref:Thiamine pyrimidine synthase n=2 Tax=Imhoffiella purpurea TaxID=1249627 RepID=W9VHZ5_9GAMM|nr:ABC transporter substrate-binding protein [Imhoffiella purpurea]